MPHGDLRIIENHLERQMLLNVDEGAATQSEARGQPARHYRLEDGPLTRIARCIRVAHVVCGYLDGACARRPSFAVFIAELIDIRQTSRRTATASFCGLV